MASFGQNNCLRLLKGRLAKRMQPVQKKMTRMAEWMYFSFRQHNEYLVYFGVALG
jgi:hypothetical protein